MEAVHGRHMILAVVAIAASCSKKTEPASGGGSGSDLGSAGSAAGSATTNAEPGKPAPAMTPELFFSEPPKWTIEGVERGLWLSVNGGPFEQSCRVELGGAMMRIGKIRVAAKAAAPEATKCEARGSYAVCAFTPPTPDPANPDSQASWVFVADDDSDETILIAVLIGPLGDWSKIEPQLPKKKNCPRPSQDLR